MRYEKASGEIWSPWDYMCVVRTLASIAADISHKTIYISNQELQYRRDDIDHVHRLLAKHPNKQMPASRLDQILITTYIQNIIKQQTPIGVVLSQCDIRAARGLIQDAKNFQNDGYQVGIRTQTISGQMNAFHMYHLGIDKKGNCISKSDEDKQSLLAHKGNEWHLDYFMKAALNFDNGWNLLLVKSKQDKMPLCLPHFLKIKI